MYLNFTERYGKWALVTGASSGIGEEFARRLAARGLNLVLVARREERLKVLAEEVREAYGIETVVAPVDLTDRDFLSTLTDQIGDRKIGLLVNNAGYGKRWPHLESDEAAETDMVLLNCWAPVVLSRHFLPAMAERGQGGMIMVSSVVAGMPMPTFSTYSSTKVFDQYFGEAMYAEMKAHGVDVLVLRPGSTRTEFATVARVPAADNLPVARSAAQVVDTALAALGKRPTVTDGWVNKIAFHAMWHLPRSLYLRVAGLVARRMLRRRESGDGANVVQSTRHW